MDKGKLWWIAGFVVVVIVFSFNPGTVAVNLDPAASFSGTVVLCNGRSLEIPFPYLPSADVLRCEAHLSVMPYFTKPSYDTPGASIGNDVNLWFYRTDDAGNPFYQVPGLIVDVNMTYTKTGAVQKCRLRTIDPLLLLPENSPLLPDANPFESGGSCSLETNGPGAIPSIWDNINREGESCGSILITVDSIQRLSEIGITGTEKIYDTYNETFGACVLASWAVTNYYQNI
jgi:hypothetical protein